MLLILMQSLSCIGLKLVTRLDKLWIGIEGAINTYNSRHIEAFFGLFYFFFKRYTGSPFWITNFILNNFWGPLFDLGLRYKNLLWESLSQLYG